MKGTMTTIQQRDLHGLKALCHGSDLRPRPCDRASTRARWRRCHRAWPRRARGVQTVEAIRCRAAAPTSSPPTSTTPRRHPSGQGGWRHRHLVNNAGFGVGDPRRPLRLRPSMRCSPPTSGRPFFLVSAFAPGMVDTVGLGASINISSMAGRLGPPAARPTGPPRRLGFIDSGLGGGVQPRGVRVNAVAPGPIYTRPEARELFDSLGPPRP